MDELRLVVALACFILGVYLIYDLFASGFNMAVLLAGIGAFIFAHFIKPKRTTPEDWSVFWELIDIVVDIPFKTVALLLRGLGRVSKGGIDGFDL